MKKLLTILILLTSNLSLQAQKAEVQKEIKIADLKAALELKSSIVASFNSQKFEHIYEMSNKYYRKNVEKEDMVDFFKSQLWPLGQITSSDLVDDLEEVRVFLLTFAKNDSKTKLLLTLGAVSPNEFFALDFRKVHPELGLQPINDNPLVNSIDSISDRAVKNYLKNPSTNCLSLGIIVDNVVSTYNYCRNTAKCTLPTDSTFYEIGSITKTFTGILLAQAVIDKKVKLTDDIRKYLPHGFKNLEYNGTPIILKDLATQTSGIPSVTSSVTEIDHINPWENFSANRLLEDLKGVKLSRVPGSSFEYSNTAIGLLGFILERVYSLRYDTLVSNYISKQAGMNETKVFLSNNESLRLIQGFDIDGNKVAPWQVKGIEGAGALRSTLRDVLKYLSFNLNNSDSSVALSQKVHWESEAESTKMGLCWQISESQFSSTKISHGGGTGGYRTYAAIYPDIDVGIVVLSNNGDLDPSTVAKEVYLRIVKLNKYQKNYNKSKAIRN